jgi:hypothetical protein
MSNQGNAVAGAASPLMPASGTPVGDAQASAIATAPAIATIPTNVIATVLSILHVLIVESNTTWTKELTNANWSTWKGSMKQIFGLCNLSEYVLGNVICPNPTHNPVGAKNWDFNNSYAAMLICKNISASQKVYAGQDNKSYEVWRNLKAIHEVTGNMMIITWIQTLFKCTAEEGNDIKEHLNNLKMIWEQINLSAEDFTILDMFFKIIISSSLPPSWDAYTQAYIMETRRHATHNPFRNMSSQEFISVITAKAKHHLGIQHGNNVAFNIKAKNNKGKGQSLLKCMTSKLKDTKINDNNKEQSDKKTKKLYCKHCKMRGHLANDCNKWDKDPCPHCGRFNHKAKDCWHKDKPKQDKGKGKATPCKRARNEETNAADSDSQLLLVMIKMSGDVTPGMMTLKTTSDVTCGRITFDSSEQGQHFNFADYDVTNYSGIDEHTLYYDWLADSATTSHIVNRHDIFKTFEPIKNTPIAGVGGL